MGDEGTGLAEQDVVVDAMSAFFEDPMEASDIATFAARVATRSWLFPVLGFKDTEGWSTHRDALAEAGEETEPMRKALDYLLEAPDQPTSPDPVLEACGASQRGVRQGALLETSEGQAAIRTVLDKAYSNLDATPKDGFELADLASVNVLLVAGQSVEPTRVLKWRLAFDALHEAGEDTDLDALVGRVRPAFYILAGSESWKAAQEESDKSSLGERQKEDMTRRIRDEAKVRLAAARGKGLLPAVMIAVLAKDCDASPPQVTQTLRELEKKKHIVKRANRYHLP